MGQIAKHTVELAELVVDGDIFPSIFDRLNDPDTYVRKNAATVIREVAKHTPEVSLSPRKGGIIQNIIDTLYEWLLNTLNLTPSYRSWLRSL